jgi:hemerythrin superfamily protein
LNLDESKIALRAFDDLSIKIKNVKQELSKYKREIPSIYIKYEDEKRYPLLIKLLTELLNEAIAINKQLDAKNNIKLAQIISDANKIITDLPTHNIPAAVSGEIVNAIRVIQDIYIKSNNKAELVLKVQTLLDEINYFLQYPGGSISGISRTVFAIQEEIENINNILLPSASDNVLTDQTTSLLDSRLSDQQREDRSQLINIWHQVQAIGTFDSNQKANDLARQFSTLFAKLTSMYYGEIPQSAKRTTHYFFSNPVPHFETRFIKPFTVVLKKKVVLIFIATDLNKFSLSATQNKLKELENFIRQETWIPNEDFLVFFSLKNSNKLEKWVTEQFPNSPFLIINDDKFREILSSYDNPTSTGTFRRMLLNVAGPKRFDVFKFENHVNSETNIFVGRTTLIDAFVNDGTHHAIYGGRKIGKSSLMHAISKAFQKNGATTAYISLEGNAADEVVICTEILQKLKNGSVCESISDFRKKLGGYLLSCNSTVVILLDEMDKYISARKKDGEPHNLISNFRGLSEEFDGKLIFFAAGFLGLWKQLNSKVESGIDNPYYNFFDHSKGALTVMDADDAEKIVRQGFLEILGYKFEQQEIPRKIVQYTSGHPAFVQKFCERLHRHVSERRETVITEKDLGEVFRGRQNGNYLDFVNATLTQNLNDLSQLVVFFLALDKNTKERGSRSSTEFSFSLNDVVALARSYEKDLSTINDDMWDTCIEELLVTSIIKKSTIPNKYEFYVPAYLEILQEYDAANQDNIYSLIRDVNKGMKNGTR